MTKTQLKKLEKIVNPGVIVDVIVSALENQGVAVTDSMVRQVYLDITDDLYEVAEKNIERRIEAGNFTTRW